MRTKAERNAYNRSWYAKNRARIRRYKKAWDKKNPERIAASQQKYLRKNRAKRAAMTAAWRLANPEKAEKYAITYRSRNRMRIRKLAEARYPAATRPRPKGCECCGRSVKKKQMHRDHCHSTNKFRGWLCFRCNAGIGLLGDKRLTVRNAIAYLTRVGDRS